MATIPWQVSRSVSALTGTAMGAYFHKGFALAKLGNIEEAIQEFDRTLEQDPDNAQAYHQKGLLLTKLGKYSDAIESYNKSIGIKPSYAPAFYDKGLALAKLGKFEMAIDAFEHHCNQSQLRQCLL
jgi:tetratricopeptide (TPR) repeat protein